MSDSMDPLFAASLRQELVDKVRTTRRRKRGWRIGGAVAGVVLVGTGAGALATSQDPTPGTDRVEVLKAGSQVDGTGTRTMSLGGAPKGATDIEVVFVCHSAGSYSVVGVLRGTCSDVNARKSLTASYWAVQAGDNRLTVNADPGFRWTLTASFSKRTRTKFGVNADGHSFGADTDEGSPDLVAVEASNGKRGYAYAKDLDGPVAKTLEEAAHWSETHKGRRVIPVYKSDGHTVIGRFIMD